MSATVLGPWVAFWRANAAGPHDNQGYRLRCHQSTDGQGRNALETIVPGLYPGRTRHIHVKVQAPNQPVLTTQLGIPVADNQNSLRSAPRVPTLLEDFILREKITHFDHERIP